MGIAPPSVGAPALKTGGTPAAAASAAAKPGITSAAKPGAPVAQKPAPVATRTATSSAPSIKGFDKVLIYVACVAALAAVGMAVWVFLKLNDALTTFQS